MKKRALTSFFIVLVTAIAIFSKFLPLNIGEYIFDLFILFITFVATMEMSTIMEQSGRKVSKFLTAIFPSINYFVFVISFLSGAPFVSIFTIQIAFVLVYALVIFIVELIKDRTKTASQHFKTALFSLIVCEYPVLFFSLMININHMDRYVPVQGMSFVFITMIILITMLTDTCAYLVGSTIKGPKLAPKISPNKTISGAIGGLVGGMLGGLITFGIINLVPEWHSILSVYGLQWWSFLLFGLFGSIFGQIGDLFESQQKRFANLKDSGTIFPGHGGMLDRIDALIFVTVFVYIVLSVLV